MPRKLGQKGLTRINGGVCLLQNYCPFCFKGKIGVSNGLYVEKDSPLINEVQALHASKGNGLCPLDLRSPGDFCTNTLLCRLVCLVCGKTTVDGSDEEFELFYDLFGSEDQCPVTTKYEIQDAMEAHGLVWTDMWDTPVHKECTKKTVCKCVVPLGTTTCPKHLRSVIPSAGCYTTTKKEPRVEVKPVRIKITPSLVSQETVSCAKSAGGLKKADWLPPPTVMTKATGTALLSEMEQKHAKVKAKRDSVLTGTMKAPTAVTKPSINTLRMEAAAANSSFKINDWAGKHPTNLKLEGVTKKKSESTGFSLKEHNEKFDCTIHGAYIIDGEPFFRRGDGVFVPRFSDVNTLNEDGTLTPLA